MQPQVKGHAQACFDCALLDSAESALQNLYDGMGLAQYGVDPSGGRQRARHGQAVFHWAAPKARPNTQLTGNLQGLL